MILNWKLISIKRQISIMNKFKCLSIHLQLIRNRYEEFHEFKHPSARLPAHTPFNIVPFYFGLISTGAFSLFPLILIEILYKRNKSCC